MLDLRRYERTRQRNYFAHPSAGNLVVVNMAPQHYVGDVPPLPMFNPDQHNYVGQGGDIRLFVDGARGGGISVTEIDG